MKKITLMVGAFLVALSAQAQTTLSQSVDPATVDTGGVACWASGTGEYRDNAFARTYDISSLGIVGDFLVSAVEFGQGSADDGKMLDVNIYTVDTETLSSATFTLISSVTVPVGSAGDLSLQVAPIAANIPAGTIAAVEIFAPDEGSVTFQRFFPGFNLAGQNNIAWLRSDGTGTGGTGTGCGIPYTNSNTIVADPQEYVINLVGEEVLGVNDNINDIASVFPNPASDVLNVKIPSSIDVTSATLFDILGKDTGLQMVNGTFNIAGLAKGIYMLNVKTSAGTLTQKIIKR
ncbi:MULTISPECIES: T9SS type A sorting domain-containing protein [Altibacter]|uniref:T9SS type A sorting domain-containing protein n=1 Tax=Altibacter TaxID=1535231 RepID=UPI0005557284|nr:MULTISPECIES: T9SS type A sorting domain-containing protein [Altibacter]MCW8981026.1 T9SS type A sorting domain-containing protein [Altibacter sp.]MCW9037355.1 T9SS type A sorting domain-containing protein [Altibacter sp.]